MLCTREGTRAAYKLKPWFDLEADAVPVHGTHPLSKAHIDFTICDIEILDPVSGMNLGRPGLGYLIDAYSGTELARVLFFGHPTSVEVVALLVRCAERYGRFPEELMLDNAMEHKSACAQSICGAYGTKLSYRPTAQARFGAPVELEFGRVSDELLNQLRGNTRLTKVVREMTRATDPRKLAVLSLSDLDELLELQRHASATRIVPRLGRTVRDAFDQGVVMHGRRPGIAVRVDATFRDLALEPHGHRVAQGPKGISYQYITYHHPCFECRAVRGQTVDIRIDPLDAASIQAYVPSHDHVGDRFEASWVTASSYSLANVRVSSWRELKLVTATLRERNKLAQVHNATITEAAIAEVLDAATELEEVALARVQAAAVRRLEGVDTADVPGALRPPAEPRIPEAEPVTTAAGTGYDDMFFGQDAPTGTALVVLQ